MGTSVNMDAPERFPEQRAHQNQLHRGGQKRKHDRSEHHRDRPRPAIDYTLQRARPPIEVEAQIEVKDVVEHVQRDAATRRLRHRRERDGPKLRGETADRLERAARDQSVRRRG